MASLQITDLVKRYGSVEVLKGIDLDIESGEFVVFVGPSGCGKSTLLRCISGLETISEGTLKIGGQVVNDIGPAQRGIAMVFQSYALYPHMNVFDNMAYSLKLQHRPKDEIRQKVLAAAEKLQLNDYLQRLPRQLSGGQRQRVAIGRAIVRDPQVFLFDEPLSNLDASLRVQMRMEIGRLKDQLPGTTMIYVTHDQVEAMTLADRIVVLNGGRIEQVGTPMELYESPKSLFVAGFIGSPRMNFVTGSLANAQGAHTVGVRPEHLAITPDGPWRGEVVYAENLGSDTYVHVALSDETLVVARTAGSFAQAKGTQVHLTPNPSNLYRFSAEGAPIIN